MCLLNDICHSLDGQAGPNPTFLGVGKLLAIIDVNWVILEPTSANARWALIHHFASVRLDNSKDVCLVFLDVSVQSG